MVSLTEVDGSDYNCIKDSNDQEELDYDENLPEDFDRVQIKPPDPEPQVLNGTRDSPTRTCELGEVNTVEDENPHQSNGVSEVQGNRKPYNENLDDLEDGEVPESDDEGADEKSNGEVYSDSGQTQGKTRNIAKLYQKYLDEGDASDEAGLLEEGEDDSECYDRSKVPCKFFLRGHCVHGQLCRYLHNTSGSFSGDQYEFVPHQPNRDILELRSPIKDRRPPPPPPQYLSDFEEEIPEAEPQSFISKAWTSGLKDAREMIKRSKQKKETDIDFEQRKMLAGIESLDDSDYNLQVQHPIEEPPPPKKQETNSPSPTDSLSNKISKGGSKSVTSPVVSKIAIPSSFGADQWQDPWQRSSVADHSSHHISSGSKSKRHPGLGRDKGQDDKGSKGRKRSGSSSSDSSRSRQGKRSRSSSSSSRSNSRSSRSRSGSPAKWKKHQDLKKSQQLGKHPIDESFKPTVNEKKINVYDTKKKPLNGGTPKTTEETLNSSNNGKPVVPPPLSTSASGTTHLPASNQKTLPDNSTAVPNNTIAPPELRLQQKASKTAEKQAKKPKRRSESSSSSGSSSNSSSSSDSESSSSDSGNEGDRVKNKKTTKDSAGNKGSEFDGNKTKHRKKNPSGSQSTLKNSDAAKIIKSIADSDLKHWKEDVKKIETSVLSTPLLLSERRNSSNRNSTSPTKGRPEREKSRNSRHESRSGLEKGKRKRSGSRSLSMSSISSASSEETSRGNHRKREKKKSKKVSPVKPSHIDSKELKKSKHTFATATSESVSGSTSSSKKATISSLSGTYSSSKSKSGGSSKHGSSGTSGNSSGGKSQSRTNRKQQLMAQLAEIEEKIARTRQKCSKEFK